MQAWTRVLRQRVFGGHREWTRLKNDARLPWGLWADTRRDDAQKVQAEGSAMKWSRRFAAVAALVMGAWMLTGIEVVGLEHSDKYVPFIKARPSLQLLYRNPVMCGECNFRSYTTLDAVERKTFEEFCRARFGLDDPRLCNAVFAKEQQLAEQDVVSKRP